MERSSLLDAASQTAETDYSAPTPLPLSVSHAGHIPNHVILLASLISSLFLVIFAVTYYIFLVKHRSRGRDLGMSPPSQSDDTDDEFVDAHQGLFLVPTLGLHPSIINSITVVEFKKADRTIDGTECSVCLSEFQEDDSVRLLPKCSHAFHIPCIDAWLRSHTNCPSCRACIISDNSSPPRQSRSSNLSPNEATQIEIFDIVGGLGCNLSHRRAVCENGVESQEVDGESNGLDYSKEAVSANGDGASPVFVDLTDKGMNVEHRLQAVRRSVSVESSSAAKIGSSVPKVDPFNQREDIPV